MATILRNPWVAGNPIGNSLAFIGREDLLCEVRLVLRRRQDNAINRFGQQRIGKTSIPKCLTAKLPDEGLAAVWERF
jgi:hypothetical protein